MRHLIDTFFNPRDNIVKFCYTFYIFTTLKVRDVARVEIYFVLKAFVSILFQV